MSYITCIVSSCDTRRKPNTDKSFAVKCFSLPKDPALRKEWLNLCNVSELEQTKDCNRKVCIKHFKEDDFVDGLKARLLNLQPTRLKKNAVPSLLLNHESDSTNAKKDEKSDRFRKKPNLTVSNTNIARSVEYLSSLIPIAPKVPILNQTNKEGSNTIEKRLSENSLRVKLQEQHSDSKQLNDEISSPHLIQQRLKILQHDNAMYKKRISTLLDNQNKLVARIKDLEEEIKSEKENFDAKMKDALSNTLTSNQIDIITGKRIKVWWTDVEYIKAQTLRNLSKQAYYYVRDMLNYPLPSFAALQQWVAKVDGEIDNCHEIKRKRIKLQCDLNDEENTQDSTVNDTDMVVTEITVMNDGKSNDSNFNDDDIDLNGKNVEYEIEVDKNGIKNEDGSYKLSYNGDNDVEEIINTEINESYGSNNEFYESDAETDDFYEELVIENLSDNDGIDDASSSVSIQEENG